jgi:hypothetical protein
MAGIGTAFGQYGSTIQLARVDDYGYDTVSDDDPDSPGNIVPNGTLSITLLTRDGSHQGVPFVLPTVGSGSFVGSLPEVGSTCVVAFLDQQKPVIIGFLPPNLANLVGTRQTLPNMQPGEVLLQAGTPDADAAGNDNVFVGAKIRLDQYGRVIITAQDYKLTCGYLLSNEYSPDVTTLNDPITGEAIFLQETVVGGTSRRVGAGGSTVWTYGKDKVERIGGDVDTQVQGQMVVLARRGQTYQDKKGNSFGLDSDGNFFVETGSGEVTISAQGDSTFESGGNENHRTAKGYRQTVNYDHSTTVGGNRKAVIGNIAGSGGPPPVPVGDTTLVLGAGGSQEIITLGAKFLSALGGITLIVPPAPIFGAPPVAVPVIPGGIALISPAIISLTGTQVFIGGPAAVDPVVLTSKLAAFLTAFITAISNALTPTPGAPLFPAGLSFLGQVNPGSANVTLGSLIARVLS